MHWALNIETERFPYTNIWETLGGGGITLIQRCESKIRSFYPHFVLYAHIHVKITVSSTSQSSKHFLLSV